MARIIDAFTQFFDDNGDPLVDGFLKFVESGTNNTDKDTFADVNETIPNANPVPLDGAGRCPNVFGTGAYNVISYTNAMVQIQQFDPVSADTLVGNFSDWNSTAIYDEGDIVVGSDGLYYRSITADNQNQNPISSPGQWEQFKFIGIWNTNITYAVGDSVYGSDGFFYTSRTNSNLGNDPISDTTNWRPGAEIQFTKGADIASATALPLGADGNYFDITGTTAITSIDPVGVGAVVKLHFDDVLTLTYNATDLILPGGANITTAAGDEAEFVEYASGDWRCVSYEKADGTSIIASNTPFRGCLAYLTSDESTTNVVSEALNLTSEIYDTDSIHDTSTNPSRMTVPSGVTRVRLIGQVEYAANATGYRRAFIFKGGVTFPGAPGSFIMAVSSGPTIVQVSSPVLSVSATEYFELRVQQSSGGVLNVTGGNDNTWFAMEIIE